MTTGGDLIARMLAAEDVGVVFGIIDGSYFGLYSALHEHGIRLISPRHETCAVHMAGAYARITGKLGVCIASNGPGVQVNQDTTIDALALGPRSRVTLNFKTLKSTRIPPVDQGLPALVKDLEDRAIARFHCTSTQAATIAQEAQAGKLLLGHFSSKYEKLDAFLEEAQEIFPNTELALEGVTYRV